MLNSLKARSIITGIVVSILMLGLAQYGRLLLDDVVQNDHVISRDYRQLGQAISRLKSGLLDTRSSLYLYMLTFEPEQKNRIQTLLQNIQEKIQRWKKFRQVRQDRTLKKDANDLNHVIQQAVKTSKKILSMSPNERYPGMNLIANQLGPNNERFIVELQNARQEAEDLINEGQKSQQNVKVMLENLRYTWGQMIGATRTLIAARSGVYGTPLNSMEVVINNLKTYSEVVVKQIKALKQLDDDHQLGMQQSDAVYRIDALMDFRLMATTELEDILMSEDWRHDIPLILGKVNPLFNQAQALLLKDEARVNNMTQKTLMESAKSTQTLSDFLWISGISMAILTVVLYLFFEFWMRRPLLRVAEAMDKVGQGQRGVQLPASGVLEIDSLVKAFELMQEQVTARQQRIQTILDNAGEGIITIDDHGVVESFNTAAEDIFGFHEHEIVGKNINLLMPQPVGLEHDGYLQRYRQTGGSSNVVLGATREVSGQRKNGEIFPLDLTISVVFQGDERKFIGVLKDITDNKLNQQKLRRAKEKAEQAHQVLLQRNEAMIRSLEQLKQAQAQLVEAEKMASLGMLVAGVAHEINTPIGIGVTASSHLQQELKDLSAAIDDGSLTKSGLQTFLAEAMDAVNILENNLQRGAELVKSFKQVAVDQTSEEQREFNIKQYMDEILLNLRPKLKRTQHKIQVDCDNDLLVQSYPGAFSQIFTNLIMNSLIHGYDEGEWGQIEIKFEQQGKTRLMIDYQDDGKGMTAEQVRHVFEPFFTTRRGEGGSGLGMHIVYNLVTQTLKGRVSCYSEPGKGVCFHFDLPVKLNS